jgi:hypothetical protein
VLLDVGENVVVLLGVGENVVVLLAVGAVVTFTVVSFDPRVSFKNVGDKVGAKISFAPIQSITTSIK